MPAHLTGTSFRGSVILPLAAGVACFAFVCSGFWVFKSQRRRHPVTASPVFTYHKPDIGCDTNAKEEREDRISQLPDDKQDIDCDTDTKKKRDKQDIGCDTNTKEEREDRISQLPDDKQDIDCDTDTKKKREHRISRLFTSGKQNIACDTDAKKNLGDRISQLPDDIICLIISQLQTRDAVRTSVLSRRWRHVYTTINKVSFSCSYMHRSPCCRYLTAIQCRRKFGERVDTFLQHHAVSKIMSFELVCCFHGCVMDSYRKWIGYLGACGVERLSIRFCSLPLMLESGPPVFSTDFLPEASSLTHLHLKGGSFRTPNQNVLKDLKLEFISFTPEDVECILTNCSSLRSLTLLFCVLPYKLQIVGSALQLKSLMIYSGELLEEIELSAINLFNFEIGYRTLLRLSFSNVPLLRSVVIDCFSSGVTPYIFGKIAKDLPHLERVVFITYARFFEEWKMDGTLNELSNLRELVLLLESRNRLNLLELVTLLNACPLLHKFQISMKFASTFNRKQAKERVVRRDTQLKELEFNGFTGTNHEYEFILYILENVGSLKRLSISVHPVLYRMFMKCWGSVIGDPWDDEMKRRYIGQRLQRQVNSKNVEIMIR